MRLAAAVALATTFACGGPREVALGPPPDLGSDDAAGADAAPRLSWHPAALDFGALTVGALSAGGELTLQNDGGAAADPLTLTVGLPDQFLLDGSACARLDAHARCTAHVRYAPTAPTASQVGTQLVASAPGADAVLVALDGDALPTGSLAFAPDDAHGELGSVKSGATTATHALAVVNQGKQGVTVDKLAFEGSGALVFAVTSDACVGKSLAAGARCAIAVHGVGSAAGRQVASLRVQAGNDAAGISLAFTVRTQ
jgi:hypothetical protein